MAPITSPIMVVAAAFSLGWLVWSLWHMVSPAKSLPGIPLVQFDGDNSRERYTSDAASLVGKGYDTTSTMSKVGGPRITDEIQSSARVDLNRALNKLIEPMQSLCFRAAEKEMPACPNWSSIVLYPKILELFSQMSARVMVGPKLCDAWPAISMRYITRVLAAQGAIRKRYWPSLYWTAYYLNPEVAEVNEARREAAELVRPVLEARQAAFASSGSRAERHDDFIQWVMDSYRAGGKAVTSDEVVQNIFIVMFASMHGTSFVALQALFSLLGTSGALTEIPTVQRYAVTAYTFKDGLHVPAGTVVSFPNLRHNLDPAGALVTEAGTFDGKRWLRRRAGFDVSKFQFASTAEDAFDCGGGPHACPGRFMAEVTIKLILISLVTKYDMKLPEGALERPVESRRFMDLTPDTSMPVLLRDLRG
ncbi:hypothetical protein J7T55_002451 [Diaporthe amygdali]|uniref:uncharacterized protein n=1 Tax=Phomopsis amygdali TaxID=1214568 RepID=UPI0022FE74E4|nr:uncharacterized protein J7T55_002451 [Diaporthe amygdali]KAJ0121941.1 hypothetical protein J7T55_002451 [Diaporthe amygdali]